MNAELIDITYVTVGELTDAPYDAHLATFLVQAGGQVFELSEWAHEGKLAADLAGSNILSWMSIELEELIKLTGLESGEIFGELEGALQKGFK